MLCVVGSSSPNWRQRCSVGVRFTAVGCHMLHKLMLTAQPRCESMSAVQHNASVEAAAALCLQTTRQQLQQLQQPAAHR
jgi:hypothetical protein